MRRSRWYLPPISAPVDKSPAACLSHWLEGSANKVDEFTDQPDGVQAADQPSPEIKPRRLFQIHFRTERPTATRSTADEKPWLQTYEEPAAKGEL